MIRAQPKPGFLISDAQFDLFWRLFASAARVQKWPSSDQENRRRELLASLGWKSLKDVDQTQGFDDLKSALLELADVVQNEAPDAGKRRRLFHEIEDRRRDLIEAGYAPRAIEKIYSDRFHLVDGAKTLDDLPTPELVNVLRTLTARLASWYRRAQARSLPNVCSHHADDRRSISKTASATQIVLFAG